jgi:glycosyltransferase involved in cell wall biosynthesis/2-polyprenyl-3-methyl-5-hydroxy-6-metoxy-1,4-benzoquinol methylase
MIPITPNTPLPDVSASSDIGAPRREGEPRAEDGNDDARKALWYWVCAQCSGETVLVVGAAQVGAAILLAREGLTVTVIDLAPAHLVRADAEIGHEIPLVRERIRLVETDLAALPASPAFDAVVVGHVLEQQAQPERFLRQAAQRLNAAGRVVLACTLSVARQADSVSYVMPRHLSEWSGRSGLRVQMLDFAGGDMRAVLDLGRADRAVPPAPAAVDLLRATESAALQIEQTLRERLDEQIRLVGKTNSDKRALEQRLLDAKVKARAAEHEQANAAARLQAQQRAKLETLEAAHQQALEDLQSRLLAKTAAHEKDREAHRLLMEQHSETANSLMTLQESLGQSRDTVLKAQTDLLQRVRDLEALRAAHRQTLMAAEAEQQRLRDQLTRAARELEKATPQEPASKTKPTGRAVPSVTSDASAIKNDTQTTPAPNSKEDGSLANLAEQFAIIGSQRFPDYVQALGERVHKRTLALRLIQLGKQLADDGQPEKELELAQLAFTLDQSDRTLKGAFEAVRRTMLVEAASRFVRVIERTLGSDLTNFQSTVMEKFRKLPVDQLRVLPLIGQLPVDAVQGIPGRICYVLHNTLPYSSGGYATRSHGVAGGLVASGYEVIVVSRPGFPLDIKEGLSEDTLAMEDMIDGLRYVRLPSPQRRGTAFVTYIKGSATAIERQLRLERPALVMAASNHVTALPALIAARRLGLPFVYEVRGLWEVTRLSRDKAFQDTTVFAVQRLLESKVAQLADYVFTLTEPMREELLERGVPAERIELLPNSCSPERFLPRARDEALSVRLGIPPGVPVIGYIGTFVDYEGLEDLASACALLKQRGLSFRLLLVGNEDASGQGRGPITEQIQAIATAQGFADWLVMPGRVPHDEVESYYSLIDVAPFPRKPWPVCEMVSPMKPLEALAMEKAVLVSSVRALSEMIADGRTGRVFAKGDLGSLADCLAELLADPDLRARLGRQGREWVCAERTWQQIGRRFDAVISRQLPAIKARPAAPVQVTRAQTATPALAESTVAGRAAAPTGAAPGAHRSSAPAAVGHKPSWWTQIDEPFRAVCAFVDVSHWQNSDAARALRRRYVERFGEEAVMRRMPAANWARADICADTVGTSESILDIGSGLGEFVNLIALNGQHRHITSVDRKDYDLWMDVTGTLHREYLDFFALDESLAADVVTCFEVIEHLPPERVAEAVGILRRLARGKLFVSVPFMEPLPLYRGHFTRFTSSNLTELFPDATFTVFGKGDGKDVKAWIMCEVRTVPPQAVTAV